MSTDPFPERVSPRRWCDRNGTINSSIPLGKLPRLSEYLDDNHGQAEVCLSFDKDASGYCCLTGTVSAKVSMQCQRCLESVGVALASDLDIKVAGNDAQARQIADNTSDPLDRLEIVVCEDGELNLLAVVEDELIMSLPIVASHDSEQCNEAFSALRAGTQSRDNNLEQGNITGMEVLEKLKRELQDRNKGKNKK